MPTGLKLLQKTNWARLYHAYGQAIDTPRHLLALLERDVAGRQAAMSHLWSAIIHQGTPWTATGTVAFVLVGLLKDERIDQGLPIRAHLLAFLNAVAHAPNNSGIDESKLEQMAAVDIEEAIDRNDQEMLYGDETISNAFYARSILECLRARPAIVKVMLDELEANNPDVRTVAAMGAAALAQSSPFLKHQKRLRTTLHRLASLTQDTDERAAYVLALGEIGDEQTLLGYLEDPSVAVQMCGALTPALATNEAAHRVLITVLENHVHQIDDWFTKRPPQFSIRPRFAVVQRLLDQINDFSRLLKAAVAVVGVTEKFCVDYDWGPLLAAAFAESKGKIKTDAQAVFLEAMVKRTVLWDTTNGNALRWFRQVDLPFHRASCRQFVRDYRSIQRNKKK